MLKPPFSIAELCRRNNKTSAYMKVITIESSAYRTMLEQIAEIAGYVREAKEERRRKEAETKDRLLEDCTVSGDAATPGELKRNHALRTGSNPTKGRRR